MSRWTEEEITTLGEIYHLQPIQITADLLGRSYGSVNRKAHSLGLQRHPQFGLKDMSEDVARRAAKIFTYMGSIRRIAPTERNSLRNPIKHVRINGGKRSLPDLEWLLENVGGRMEEVTASDRNRSWYIWGIYRQDDVNKFLEAIRAFN